MIDRYIPAVQLFAARLVLFQEAAARRLGLTATELKCFRLVQAGHAATAVELATETGLTPASLSVVVERLVEKDFLGREQDVTDRRRWILTVRPGSVERASAVYGPHGERIATVLANYTLEDFDFLLTFFADFGAAMKDSALEMASEPADAGHRSKS